MGDPEGGTGGQDPHPGNPQVAIGFLKNTGAGPIENQLGQGGLYSSHDKTKKNVVRTPLTIIYGSAHVRFWHIL